MRNLILAVLALVLFGVFRENLNNLTTAVVTDGFAVAVVLWLPRVFGVVGFQPLLQFGSCHVDELVELGNYLGRGLHCAFGHTLAFILMV